MDNTSLAVLIFSALILACSIGLECRKRALEKRKRQTKLNEWFIKYSSEQSQP